MTGTRHRGWCFTLNNYTDSDYTSVCALSAQYLIVGKEVGEEETPHLQGYIYFPNGKSFTAVKRTFRVALGHEHTHLERALGTPEQNKTYCSKGGDFVEVGQCPRKGKRSDLTRALEIADDALPHKRRRCLEEVQSMPALAYLSALQCYRPSPTREQPTIYWLWGATGTGKSHWVNSKFPQAYRPVYTASSKQLWFEGYDEHRVLLLDDFRAGDIKFNELLRLFDPYPCRISVKGASAWAAWDTIIVTSPVGPESTFTNGEFSDIGSIEQIVRRITHVGRFYFDGEERVNTLNEDALAYADNYNAEE